MEILKIVENIVSAADDIKAQEIRTLDLREISSVTDYFVICTGSSTTQTKAISDHIEKKLKENQNLHILRREGYQNGSWILLDYGNVVVHIFKPEERTFYNIEKLWGDAPVIETGSFIGD